MRVALLVTLVVVASATAGRMLAQADPTGFWNVVASGGGSHSSETLSMTDTISQTVVGQAVTNTLRLVPGFQAGLALQSVVPPIITDLVFKKLVFSNGGGKSSSESLTMLHTIGQPAIGPTSAGNTAIHAGFLAQSSSVIGTSSCGELDRDGQVNVLDVIFFLQILVGKLQPGAEQLRLADVDSSGTLNVLDGIALLRHVAGAQSALSCPPQ